MKFESFPESLPPDPEEDAISDRLWERIKKYVGRRNTPEVREEIDKEVDEAFREWFDLLRSRKGPK